VFKAQLNAQDVAIKASSSIFEEQWRREGNTYSILNNTPSQLSCYEKQGYRLASVNMPMICMVKWLSLIKKTLSIFTLPAITF